MIRMQHRRRAVLGAASMIALTAAFTAQAQTAETDAPQAASDVIVVTGYRGSIQQAIDIKRDTVGFSDSIIATDIADFPEQNLAEALQRIPGVTIERNKGLGSRVNVRGLPSEFTHVTINDLATASGSGGREVNFDIFPSELVQSVTVQKSPTAADEEGGIAGNVTIRTARPFDFPGRRIVASAEAAYNSISEEIDPQFSFLASDTWGDWGGLVSLSMGQRTNRTDSNSGINFRPMSRWLDKGNAQTTQALEVLERDAGVTFNDYTDHDEADRVVFLDKIGDRVYVNDQEKWGFAGSLQYQPDETFSLSFNALLGTYDTVEDEYDAAAYSASSRSTLDQIYAYDDTTLSEYGIVVLTDAAYTLTQHEFLSKERISENDYAQFSVDGEWMRDQWTISALAGYSGARRTYDYANLKHVAYAPTRSRYTETGGEVLQTEDPNSIDMYNTPSAFIFEQYQTDYEEISDDKYAAQIDINRVFDWSAFSALSSIDFGLRYTMKTKEREFGSASLAGPNGSWAGVRTMADSELRDVTEMTPGGAYTARDLSWSQISNDYARSTFRPAGFVAPFDPGQFYEVEEDVLAAYAMANFDFNIGPVPVFVNAGARYIDTSVTSSGFHQIQNPDGSTGFTAEPVSQDGDYQKVLPAFNMTADLTDNLVLRAAASQTLIRPSLTDLAYRRTASFNSFRFTDGNPALEPTYADQWEAGLEYYLDNGGLLAASYFWKEIEGVVRNQLTGIVPNVTKYNANGTIDGVYDFDVYQPVNAEGSYEVSGFELVAVMPLDFIHPVLEGFGVNANFTFLDSSLTGESDLGIPTSPVGLADTTYNATLYYENGPLEARIAYNYKDDYVEDIGRNAYPIYRTGYGQLDFAASYQLNDMFQVQLQGINITDEATQGYTIDPSFPTMNEFSGSRITLGVRGEF